MSENDDGWVNARDRLPPDYRPVLCIMQHNDQGEYMPWQQVLYYDFKRTKRWYENDISACVKGAEIPLSDWHSVLFWKPLDWPAGVW